MKKVIPIVMVSDNNYAPLVSVVIASICYNTKSDCKFYIINSNITPNRKQKIQNLKNSFNNFDLEFIDTKANDFFEKCKNAQPYHKIFKLILRFN